MRSDSIELSTKPLTPYHGNSTRAESEKIFSEIENHSLAIKYVESELCEKLHITSNHSHAVE